MSRQPDSGHPGSTRFFVLSAVEYSDAPGVDTSRKRGLHLRPHLFFTIKLDGYRVEDLEPIGPHRPAVVDVVSLDDFDRISPRDQLPGDLVAPRIQTAAIPRKVIMI